MRSCSGRGSRCATVSARWAALTSQATEFYAEALDLWPAEAEGRTDLIFQLGNARFHYEGSGDEFLQQARDLLMLRPQPYRPLARGPSAVKRASMPFGVTTIFSACP